MSGKAIRSDHAAPMTDFQDISDFEWSITVDAREEKSVYAPDHERLTRWRSIQATFLQIAANFNAEASTNISMGIVQWIIIDMSFRCRMLTHVPLLPALHKVLLLAWVR
ncbi:hypothetical protein TNCV_2002271 [Trichonephila clavipes]|nr:hypothetical protein TNCV_2002271 [Trichonephila clavipes]